jgi:predicted CxxxxCH...CXXCH cytochrome family protein
MCHGNSPNSDTVNKPGSPAHSAHAVGIHFDDIYNGVDGKFGYYSSSTKPSAHGDPNQSTIISCDLCHTDTVATAVAGKNTNDKNSVCNSCHSATSRTPDIKRAAHINGSVDVKFASVNVRSKAQIRDASFSSYSGVWARTSYKVDSGSYDTAKKSLNQASFTAAGVAGQGTCATVSCHNGYTVKWNDSLTCESCHSRL